MIEERLDGHTLMLYDGLCGLCNDAVSWVIKHDHADRFRFAAQQSAVAAAALARHGIDRETMLAGNSVYLVLDAGSQQERLLTQSDVTVYLLLSMGRGWRILGRILRAVPRFLRNAAYRIFARNRYRLARRYEACPIPAEADRMKFIA